MLTFPHAAGHTGYWGDIPAEVQGGGLTGELDVIAKAEA